MPLNKTRFLKKPSAAFAVKLTLGEKMMPISQYKDIMRTIQSLKIRECHAALKQKYPNVPFMTLGSIVSNLVQKRMKSNHGRHNTPEIIDGYYKRFESSVISQDEKESYPGIILRLSDEIGITPVLTARFVLEGYLRRLQKEMVEAEARENEMECSFRDKKPQPYNFANIRTEITRLLRNTTLIQDSRLAYEVYLCLVYDDNYGPCPDVIKRTVGSDHEMILQKQLEAKEISFLDEKQLRLLGYDKTPDFKLDIPIAIEGHVVNWIESKATFGDEDTHQTYLKEQLTSYFNRFGPGLVIYWLGYVNTLDRRTPKGIFVKDHLPDAITKINPSVLSLYDTKLQNGQNQDEKPSENPKPIMTVKKVPK